MYPPAAPTSIRPVRPRADESRYAGFLRQPFDLFGDGGLGMTPGATTSSTGTTTPLTAGSDGPRLRILHVTAGSDAGGLSRYIYDLSAAMHAAGHEVAVAGQRGEWHWLFEKAPFPWVEIPAKGGPVSLLKCAALLGDYCAARPVDVVHTHYRRGTLIGRRLQRRLRPTERRVPLLYTLHLSHLAIGWPQRIFGDFGDHTHVASAQAKEWLVDAAGVEPSQVSIIPHGIDAARFPRADDAQRAAARAALGLSAADRVGAYVGRLDYPKNVDWVLDVAERARRRVANLKLLLAGSGPQELVLADQVRARGLGDVVKLLGHREPLPVYQAADAVLLPSLREGFSLVTAEAMSAGVPVLRTRTSGATELIVEGVTGRSTPIEHGAFVTAAVEFLALDGATLRQMGRAASAHVQEHFRFEQQVARTVDLYRTLAAQSVTADSP